MVLARDKAREGTNAGQGWHHSESGLRKRAGPVSFCSKMLTINPREPCSRLPRKSGDILPFLTKFATAICIALCTDLYTAPYTAPYTALYTALYIVLWLESSGHKDLQGNHALTLSAEHDGGLVFCGRANVEGLYFSALMCELMT